MCRQMMSILFNQICIYEEILPPHTHTHMHTHTHTHTYIYIYIPKEAKVFYRIFSPDKILYNIFQYTNCIIGFCFFHTTGIIE